jgi:allophanate hydrolase
MKTASEALNTARSGDPAIWIHLPETVSEGGPGPLSGMPFAVKDNIDVAGMPTTAGCPDYAYTPDKNATVVQKLVDAGAVPMGKTNLDQFATGLVGVRSPYGVPKNAYDPAYIPGGSSSGSAVAVATEQVAFALGTDTAGSGRVPAAFNNLVGLKPTRGVFSNTGLVPACKTLDCISVFANTVADARTVFKIAGGYDPTDPWSREDQTQVSKPGPVRFGVPEASQLQFFGNTEYERLFHEKVSALEALGWQKVVIDLEAFMEAARLLYEGPWVAERTAAIEDFLRDKPESLHPVTRAIIEGGFKASAVDAFNASYRLAELKRKTSTVWADIDLLVTPTAGTHYTVAEVEADPVQTNSNLGTYTNFMNLLDLCAVAVPAGFTAQNMPFGITLQAPALHDLYLLDRAEEVLSGKPVHRPASDWITFAVCGAHLEGLPLNHQITDRGGFLVEKTKSAPCYQFIALPGTPAKPGMIRVAEGGSAIDLELWSIPLTEFGSFVQGIPPPLGMGTVQLSDGRNVHGFICEAIAATEAEDITSHGSWKAFLNR